MIYLCLLLGFSVQAQSINLRGIISNKAGKSVANAVVSLTRQGLKSTTGADGTYSISKATSVQSHFLPPETENIALENGLLKISLVRDASVNVRIFDIKGTLLHSEMVQKASPGDYSLDIEKSGMASNLLVVHASINNREMSFRYIPNTSGKNIIKSFGTINTVKGKLSKVSAVNDTLKVTATGYAEYALAIHNYDTTINMTLDSSGAAGKSSGCGTTPTLLKSTPPPNTKMNYNYVTIQGKKRQYLLWYPDNYDNTHPYRLIICYHWFSGSASQVFDCKTEGISCYTTQTPFFNLLNFATNTTIFIAPDGIDAGWTNTNDRDLEFTDSILAQVKSNFCIDTTHIFACGFSYGGAMSYAIACSRAPVFRAVAVYAGGAMSGGADLKLPIAYYASHGIDDGGITSGRKARDHFVEINECTPQTPMEPAKGSGTHICTKYSGCSSGHPVEWCAFDGGHDPSPKDRGQQSTWNAGETWSFFTQF
jgi:poly(3-hydroxybutyrate) depolymerase